GQDVTALILTEEGCDRRSVLRLLDRCTDAGGNRHLGNGNGEAAIGDVVRCRYSAISDQLADEVAGLALVREVNLRGRADLLAVQFAQVSGLAKVRTPFLGCTNEQ